LDWGRRPDWDRVWDQNGYDRGRQLWTEQLKKHWDSPFVYMNAAEYLSGNDNEQAEQALLEGQRMYPTPGLHWEVFLARHYAWALAGLAGQLSDDRNVLFAHDDEGAAPSQRAYARKVRKTLLASKDSELLTRTVEQFQHSRSNLEFSRSLIEHVLAREPENRTANLDRYALERYALELRAETDPGSLSESDRMQLLTSQLEPAYLNHADAQQTEARARELLALTAHKRDADYGTSVFLAHMALGEAAFARGQKAEAVRHLLAASEAPSTEFLRYSQIDMSLARELVDAGEREAVATFLERCAKFNRAERQLGNWAGQIRKGLNPNLTPTFRGVRRAG
jgi:hypothetical protein